MEKFNSNKFIVVICFFISLIAWGCGADDNALNDGIQISVIEESFKIGKAGTLTYSLGAWPMEGGLGISLQPKHFLVSHIVPSPLGAQYEYIPSENFTGNDYVEITRGASAGGSKIFAKTIIKITIEVTSD